MNKIDVHKAFKLAMDKHAPSADFGGCPAFLKEEIDSFLDQAYLEVISNKYTGTQNNIQFEQTSKRVADLQGLITNVVIDPNSNEANYVIFTLPDNFLFYVDSYLNTAVGITRVNLTDHAVEQNFMITTDNDPWIPTPMCVLQSNTAKIYYDIHDIESVTNWNLNYIHRPTKFSELEDTVQIIEVTDNIIYEVINRAALIALDNIESQRTQIKGQLNQIQE